MLKFTYSSYINAPVKTVWEFHERADILEILTPPWQPVQIIRHEGGLEIGAISEFRLFLGLLPVQWVAKHIECEKYKLFTDEQIQGPMVSWIHRHEFVPENGKTKLTDAIAFELPGGFVIEQILNCWIQQRLYDMFAYRHQVTKRECEGR